MTKGSLHREVRFFPLSPWQSRTCAATVRCCRLAVEQAVGIEGAAYGPRVPCCGSCRGSAMNLVQPAPSPRERRSDAGILESATGSA